MADLFSSFPESTTVLIQGASRGIGLSMVRLSLENSHVSRVIATSRNPNQSEALLSLRDQHPDKLHLIAMDISSEDSIRQAALDFQALQEELHLILNVSGVLHDKTRQMSPEKKLDDLRPEDALYAFQVNALGPLLVAKHFLPFLSSQRAVIANLSARVGSISDNHLGGWYSYRASKAAQNMFTRTLSIELGRYRKSHQAICVALHPGTVETDLSAPFRKHVPSDKLFDPERAALQLLEIIDGLTTEDQGKFFAWDGQLIPW